jgi:hypothetical protein
MVFFDHPLVKKTSGEIFRAPGMVAIFLPLIGPFFKKSRKKF